MTKHIGSKRRLIKAAVFSTVCMLFPLKAYAENKVIEVPVKSTYEDCEFIIQGKDDDFKKYSFLIEGPDGNVYKADIGEDGAAHCTIDTVPSGTWKVTVNNDAVNEAQRPTTDKDGNPITPVEKKIGEVTVSLKQNQVKEVSVDDQNEITVSKELTGLKIYFKDDSVIVTWTDSSVQSVNVRVVDTNTQKVLANESVDTGEYECPLPDSTKQITVSVVPSTSLNVEGAGQQFTYDVNNHPAAVITFPDIEYTNNAVLEATAELKQQYTLQTVVNDSVVNTEKDKTPGRYTEKVPLREGDNDIKIYVIDANGNMRSTEKDIVLDTKPPSLMIENNFDGITTTNEKIQFKGKAEDYNKLTFNGKTPINAAYDGTFTVDADLTIGENKFLISAEDNAGNVAQYKAVVTRVPEKNNVFKNLLKNPSDLLPPLVGLGAVIAFIISKIRKRRKRKNIDDSQLVPSNETEDGPLEENDEEEEEKKSRFPFRKKKKPSSKKKEKMSKPLEDTSESKPETKVKPKHIKKSGPSIFRILLQIGFPAAVAAGLLRFVLCITVVSSASMVPTINVGDLNVASRLAYLKRSPERGDIIILSNKETKGQDYVKRIIGLPGDKVSFKNGYVYINNMRCNEEYLDPTVETNCTKSFEVPEQSYFVLGDNRENSIDSRYWKDPYVKRSDIVGKVITDLSFPMK